MAATAGMFIYIAASDLMPELHHIKGRHAWLYAVPFFLGVLLIAGMGAVFSGGALTARWGQVRHCLLRRPREPHGAHRRAAHYRRDRPGPSLNRRRRGALMAERGRRCRRAPDAPQQASTSAPACGGGGSVGAPRPLVAPPTIATGSEERGSGGASPPIAGLLARNRQRRAAAARGARSLVRRTGGSEARAWSRPSFRSAMTTAVLEHPSSSATRSMPSLTLSGTLTFISLLGTLRRSRSDESEICTHRNHSSFLLFSNRVSQPLLTYCYATANEIAIMRVEKR